VNTAFTVNINAPLAVPHVPQVNNKHIVTTATAVCNEKPYTVTTKQYTIAKLRNEFITRERPGKGIRGTDSEPARNVL